MINRITGHVLLSLRKTEATDSLCTLQDDTTIKDHHHTSVNDNCSKVCVNHMSLLTMIGGECNHNELDELACVKQNFCEGPWSEYGWRNQLRT